MGGAKKGFMGACARRIELDPSPQYIARILAKEMLQISWHFIAFQLPDVIITC